ncbi:hypothetical protein [Mucilaginibacter xinganensis]|uniref:DoxX family protein n=1 Tax=Mucilaginibacter xinganensis TaxID=1234841 RepID=A0A223NU28_9SPHI|nr:hypothetical protein [Mucilaginibacter xinganensis]ASU33184.1 hypothetical protein MuYL_1286 [Mucilaginibacter xinganensis]
MTTLTAESPYWSALQKIAFRFFFLFFILFIFFNPNGVIPFYDGIYNLYIEPFHKLIPWLGAHVLHLAKPITEFTGGSGDTTYDYVIILFMTVISVVVTVIWSITGRNTRNYNKLLYWLTVVIRYYVAITMVLYGSIKIIKLQFPAPGPGRLIQPLGTMSPMGLAWTYMGYSTGFNIFTGMAELTCGLLLFFRKTTTLGAIVGLVVAGNIMAINYCFDVPVKLLSTFLVLMSLFILVRDFRRLVNFFFLNRDAQPSNLSPHRFKARWKNISLITVKYLIVAYVVIGYMISAVQAGAQYGDNAKKPPLYGLYNVESFVKNNDTLPPLTTDTTRWNKLVIGNRYSQVKYMNDTMKNYNFALDTIKHKITLNTFKDTLHKFVFDYTLQKPDVMLLKGNWKKDSVQIRLHKVDLGNFLLLKRGFHFINEEPFNR